MQVKKVMLVLSLLLTQLVAKEISVTLTEVEILDKKKESCLLIDSDDPLFHKQMQDALATSLPTQTFIQNSNASQASSGPILVKSSRAFMAKERAGSDMLIGTGFCLGSVLFSLAFGETTSTESGTTTTVEGPMGCVSGAACLTGVFFFAKGFFELFMQPSYTSKGKTTNEFIADGKVAVKNRKTLVFGDSQEAKDVIVKYCLSY